MIYADYHTQYSCQLQTDFIDIHGGMEMKRPITLIIRLVLSAVFAVILSRLFFDNLTIPKIVALGAALFCLAYVFEYARKKNKEGN